MSCILNLKDVQVITHLQEFYCTKKICHCFIIISDRKLVSSSALLAKVSSNDDKDCKTYRKELQRYLASM